MSLGDERRKFTEAIALLTLFARYYGRHVMGQEWFLAGDQLKRCMNCEVGDEDSVHKLALAEDIYTLIVNGLRTIQDMMYYMIFGICLVVLLVFLGI